MRFGSVMLSFLLVILEFVAPYVLSGDEYKSLQEGEAMLTPLHDLTDLDDLTDLAALASTQPTRTSSS